MYKERYSKTDPEFTQQDHDYFQTYKDLLLPHVIGPKVMDIGCGEGWLTKEIAKLKEIKEVFALDVFEGQQVPDAKITYLQGKIPENLPTWKMDTVIATEFVEHISTDEFYEMCQKVHKMLVEDWAYFIGSTPNRMAETKNPFHQVEYTVEELADFFKKAGFEKIYLWNIRDLTVFKVK